MKAHVLCALLAAVITQIWGTFSWMVLPWHNLDLRQFSSETEITEMISTYSQGSGIYTLPNMDESLHQDEEKLAQWNEKAARGPFVFMSVRSEGIDPGMGLPMAIGFSVNVFMAFVLFWLLSMTSCTSAVQTALFVGAAGSLGSMFPHVSNWSWWHFPLTYCLVGIIDLFITWFFAGLGIFWLRKKLT